MQKKDLKIHLIKVHGAPKPHAVSSATCSFHCHVCVIELA